MLEESVVNEDGVEDCELGGEGVGEGGGVTSSGSSANNLGRVPNNACCAGVR